MDMEGFELVSLLCSRLCHDLVSPVGAIINGLEVMADESDQEMREMAIRLITQSASRTAHRLQFARLAYGASGGPGGLIDMGEAKKATEAILDDHKVALEWQCDAGQLERMPAKLLVNSAFLAAEALPRGGTVTAILTRNSGASSIEIVAQAPMIRPIESFEEIIGGEKGLAGLAPRAAQAYYTGLIARLAGTKIGVNLTADQLSLKSIIADHAG